MGVVIHHPIKESTMQSTTLPLSVIRPDTLRAISHVGNVVTYQGEQYLCYSVEGYDYYAFLSAHPNEVTIDWGMTPSEWKIKTVALLLPMGAKIGEGLGFEVYLNNVTRGVSLAKV